MYEKYSEEHIRKEKVTAIKNKILEEIETYKRRIRHSLVKLPTDNLTKEEEEDYDYIINHYAVLNQLKDYIEQPGTFMQIERISPAQDVAIYQVHIDEINIWLQSDYNFVSNLLVKIDYNEDVYFDDKYFGYEFTNIYDKILYKDKMNELEKEEQEIQ